jgi:GTPase
MLTRAHNSNWQFDPETFTDQESRQLVEEAVREKLLNNLPQEIPYNISPEMEFFSESETGEIKIQCAVS